MSRIPAHHREDFRRKRARWEKFGLARTQLGEQTPGPVHGAQCLEIARLFFLVHHRQARHRQADAVQRSRQTRAEAVLHPAPVDHGVVVVERPDQQGPGRHRAPFGLEKGVELRCHTRRLSQGQIAVVADEIDELKSIPDEIRVAYREIFAPQRAFGDQHGPRYRPLRDAVADRPYHFKAPADSGVGGMGRPRGAPVRALSVGDVNPGAFDAELACEHGHMVPDDVLPFR